MTSQREKMTAGQPYHIDDELRQYRNQARRCQQAFNQELDGQKRSAILKE